MTDWATGGVTANGIRIHYHRTGGSNPPMVLVHGFGDNGLCWARVARAFENDFDVVMADARNHGESARAVVGPGDLAGDLAGLIEALDLQRPLLMGHSMGAATAAEVAARFPGLVSRLVLEDPPWMDALLMEDTAMTQQRRDGFIAWLSAMSDLTVDQIAEYGRKSNPAWHPEEFPAWALSKTQMDRLALEGLGPGAWQSVAAKITCATLLVYGDSARGGIVSGAVAREAEALNTKLRSQHIAGAGHNIRREQFERFVEIVGVFLRDGRG